MPISTYLVLDSAEAFGSQAAICDLPLLGLKSRDPSFVRHQKV